MSDVMKPVAFRKLLNWISEEYQKEKTIFGIPLEKFFQKTEKTTFSIFGEKCETVIGPAAGPHTQQAENIVSAYLTGARFFELKTVQILDELDIEKPCIDVRDEGYNTEWSTELSVQQAYEEYVKAWFLLHVIAEIFELSPNENRAFVFNMSVGYDLKGIKDNKIDTFIEDLKDASQNRFFQDCREELKESIAAGKIPGIKDPEFADSISPKVSNSITLSTMHGCPPEEQQQICEYLLKEKKLHTFLKLNPTLLGYEFVTNVFAKLGFTDISLKRRSFTNDMQYPDAIKMLRYLLDLAEIEKLEFGVKLSNTLAVVNDKKILPTDEMYMSGRALYPLTINLAYKLASEFEGNLKISYSGGANFQNIRAILRTGIRPVTIATDLLKPGGYLRFTQIAELLEKEMISCLPARIDLQNLQKQAENVLSKKEYKKEYRSNAPMKFDRDLPRFDCFIAPCKEACLIGQDVPEYIRLIHEKRFREAFELITTRNPLPHITGYICDHQCMLKCVRNDYEEPVLIRDLKLIAANNGYDRYLEKMVKDFPVNKIKIAVIGAGPAGLSSAYFLAKHGFDVTIFDKKNRPGGTVTFTIPGFRIPQEAIDSDLELLKKMGVKFVMNCNEDLDIAQLQKEGFQYFNICIGAWESRSLNIPNDNSRVLNAIDFLQEWNRKQGKIDLGKSIAVIGGGNSAMDGARAALRTESAKKVYIIYRRTTAEMPADREELDNALADGVEFLELLNPVSFQNNKLKCQVMKLGEPDASGRKRPIPVKGEYKTIPVDTVLTAIGELVDYDLLHKNEVKIDEQGNILKNEFNETSRQNVFISGDALRGPATVVEAIADAQKVAEGICRKEKLEFDLDSAGNYKFHRSQRQREIVSKKGVIRKAPSNLDSDRAIEQETQRCLECNLICNKCIEVCPNRANIAIKVPGFEDVNQILHLDGLCNECGNCETFCPYNGAPYKDKFTLFWSEQDFLENENDGFLVLNSIERKYRIRSGELTEDVMFDENWNTKSDFPQKEFSNITDMIRTVTEKYDYLLC